MLIFGGGGGGGGMVEWEMQENYLLESFVCFSIKMIHEIKNYEESQFLSSKIKQPK